MSMAYSSTGILLKGTLANEFQAITSATRSSSILLVCDLPNL